MNIGRKSLSLVLAAALMFGVAMVGSATAAVVYTDAAEGNYYSSITATSGTELLGQVHDLIVNTHKTYTSYDDCKNISKVTKTDPGPSGGIRDFYSQQNLPAIWDSGNTWNREHVWCQSLSNGLWGTSGAGGDMHHIRPSDSSLNSARGNHKFGETSGGTEKFYSGHSAGFVQGDVWEPIDEVKGDVARIVMYVYTHYNKGANVGGTVDSRGSGTLKFANIMAPNSESAAEDLLLEWNASDPVDDIERTRNEAVYDIQGNRNPFIDHPEYADAIWGDGSIGDPVAPTALSLSPSAFSLTVGKTQKLTLSAQPSDATKTVTWKSDNAAVASVSNGTVTANGEGVAHITATSTVASSVTASATVTVTKPAVGETVSFTITLDSFDLVDNYNFQNWSSGGVDGIAYIFGGNSSYPADKGMQFSKPSDGRSYYLANTTPVPGKITSITAKSYQYANDWTVLTSDTSFGNVTGKPTGGTNQGQKQVPTTGATWEIGGDDSFFAITYDTTEYTGYLDSITVEYVASQGETPHEHVFEYEDYTDETHLVGCKTCTDYLEEEPHVYTDDTDTTCDLCGHVRTIHVHEYDYHPLDATYHGITCKSCDEVSDKEVHEYTDAKDTTCNKCGYERTIGGDHVHTERYEEVDETHHRVTCAECDLSELEEHEYTDDADTTCNKCGYERTVADAGKLAAFHTAVQNIKKEGALSARAQSLRAALTAYHDLSETEKGAAADDYALLEAAIEAYNADVDAMNEAAQQANDVFAPRKKGEE